MRRRILVYAAAGALKDLFTSLFTHKTSNHFDENDRAEGLSLIYTQPRVWRSLGKPRKAVGRIRNDAAARSRTHSVGDVTSTPQEAGGKVLSRAAAAPDGREVFSRRSSPGVRDLGGFFFVFLRRWNQSLQQGLIGAARGLPQADAVISKSHDKFTLMEWREGRGCCLVMWWWWRWWGE